MWKIDAALVRIGGIDDDEINSINDWICWLVDDERHFMKIQLQRIDVTREQAQVLIDKLLVGLNA